MKRILSLLIAIILFATFITGCSSGQLLNPDQPVTLTIWHVYGSQTESPLNDIIDVFNKTEGKEKGVSVNVVSVTDSSSIDEALIASANDEPGSASLPDLFTAYPRIVEKIGADKLIDWNSYLSKDELAAYKEDFLKEGYFDDSLLMLPVAKSSELFFLNQTLFDRFAEDKSLSTADLASFEGIFSAAMDYYDWSDGQDMFQINDYYHYFLVNMQSIGGSFVENGRLNINSNEFLKVYEPMARAAIYGGLCTGDGYASDRWKTGEIICNIGSTAGILYLRDYVTYENNTTEDITTTVLPYPVFEGASPCAIQRGGGLFAVKSEDESKNAAAAVFAKWITQSSYNLDFVTKTGYLPVTNEAYSTLFTDMSCVENEKYRMLYSAVDDMEQYTYCALPLYEGAGEVQANFEDTVKAALSSAHREYSTRVSAGENPDLVMSELINTSLSTIASISL